MYHYEWTRTVSDLHAAGIPGHGKGQRLIRDRLRHDKFGTEWEKRGDYRGAPYYMSEKTFQTALRKLKEECKQKGWI